MDKELQHYGVLGMKWGRRKGSVSTSKGKGGAKAKKIEKRKKQPLSEAEKEARSNARWSEASRRIHNMKKERAKGNVKIMAASLFDASDQTRSEIKTEANIRVVLAALDWLDD